MRHGRYTVVRKLAEGGMAEIFLARQHGSEGFEKTVVLKRIHSAFNADEQLRNMLVDEAHISMTLHHNNVVQVLDLGRAGGRLFLVLELVDGWDLQRVIERAAGVGQLVPLGLGLHIMAEVCRALAYAHGRTGVDGSSLGIVHRDVSPENVLVSEQGEVKLADFGIAKALSKRERTATGVIKGKIAFMSPEQAVGRPLDPRSDVFSFGTMLYAVATGLRPFDAATDFEIFARVQRAMYSPPESVKPDLPPSLVTVIKRTLALEPDQRYQTADELLVDLEEIWRAEFGAPGQTELKLWLAELCRLDGAQPIGRSRAVAGHFTDGSGDLGEGDALVLGDDDHSDPGSISRTDMHLVTRGSADRPSASDMVLPVADDDGAEMLERLEARGRRRTALTAFVVSALIGGGVAAGVWYAAGRDDRAASAGEKTAAPGAPGAPGAAAAPPGAAPAATGARGAPGSGAAGNRGEPARPPALAGSEAERARAAGRDRRGQPSRPATGRSSSAVSPTPSAPSPFPPWSPPPVQQPPTPAPAEPAPAADPAPSPEPVVPPAVPTPLEEPPTTPPAQDPAPPAQQPPATEPDPAPSNPAPANPQEPSPPANPAPSSTPAPAQDPPPATPPQSSGGAPEQQSSTAAPESGPAEEPPGAEDQPLPMTPEQPPPAPTDSPATPQPVLDWSRPPS